MIGFFFIANLPPASPLIYSTYIILFVIIPPFSKVIYPVVLSFYLPFFSVHIKDGQKIKNYACNKKHCDRYLGRSCFIPVYKHNAHTFFKFS